MLKFLNKPLKNPTYTGICHLYWRGERYKELRQNVTRPPKFPRHCLCSQDNGRATAHKQNSEVLLGLLEPPQSHVF